MLGASIIRELPLSPVDVPPPGSPAVAQRTLHRTHCSSLDVWECGPGEFEWQMDSNQSACVLAGRAEVDLADGRHVLLAPGNAVFFAEGLHGHWVVSDTIRMVTIRMITGRMITGRMATDRMITDRMATGRTA